MLQTEGNEFPQCSMLKSECVGGKTLNTQKKVIDLCKKTHRQLRSLLK